jgi:hypothetical protein
MILTYTTSKQPEVVASFFSDMNRFVAVHPVITKMKPLEKNKFLVYETLKAGLLSFSFTYPALVKADTENKIFTMQATVMKLAHISMVFTISKDNSGSLIKEEIKFRSWLPVKNIMCRIFTKQHALLFKNIESSQN